MENFKVDNPVKINFGKDVCNELATNIKTFGSRVLLIYGKGSVKKNGIYDKVVAQLKQANKEIFEFSGIKSNPTVADARRAVEFCVTNKIELIVALGGGSVIDTAKAVAVCVEGGLDPWDVFKRKVRPTAGVPIISILTLAATGTEMNMFAVLQNEDTNEKIGFGVPEMYPVESYLDPSFTLSVNKAYTAYGLVDLIAHSLENYFGSGKAPLADKLVFAVVNEAIEIAPRLLEDLDNYDLRARMMWAATMALNGYNNYGRKSGDWAVHALGHCMSMLFDTPHGASLSIMYPAWIKLLSRTVPERISELGLALFNDDSVDGCIAKLTEFFKSCGSPVTLAEAGITGEQREQLKQLWIDTKAAGYVHEVVDTDYDDLLSWV